jgi:hypothetical protein
MFSECVKAIGSMSDLNHQPSIELSSYTQDNPAANAKDVSVALTPAYYTVSNVNSGSFFFVFDLENYANADKGAIFSGWNSNTDYIYFIPTYAAQAAATPTRFDSFAMFDTVLVFENGTCCVKY